MDRELVERWWPAAEPDVISGLRKRPERWAGVEDFAQIAIEKALKTPPPEVESFDHFVRWCVKVGSRARIDAIRKVRKDEVGVEVDLRDRGDTERHAIVRQELDLTLAAIRTLPPAQREALLTIEQPTSGKRESDRLSKARVRGRATLESMGRGVPGVIARPLGTLARKLRELSGSVEPGVAAAVAGAAALIGLGVAAQVTPAHPEPGARKPAEMQGAVVRADAPLDLSRVAERLPALSHQPRTPTFANYTPVPAFHVPVLPRDDGSSLTAIDGRPSGPEDPGQVVCFDLLTIPYRCYATPFPSIDTVFGYLPPGLRPPAVGTR